MTDSGAAARLLENIEISLSRQFKDRVCVVFGEEKANFKKEKKRDFLLLVVVGSESA